MLRDEFPVHRSPFDLFRFADEARDGRRLVEFGYDPWWTEPGLRLAMLRPASSALAALDLRLFGLNAAGYHLHSMLWWLALLAAVTLLYAELLPAPVAMLAIVLFAVDEGQSGPVAWIANRSTLVACAFGVLGLWLHVRARGRPGLRWLEAVAFAAALLAGENAYGVIAYTVALELVGPEPPRERWRSLTPALLPSALALALGSLLGYGARGSAFYLSPLASPGAFVRAVLERVPALYADLVLGVPASRWVGTAAERSELRALGVAGVVVLGAVAVLSGARRPRDEARTLQALFAGSVLAALPAASALPEDRLLVPASLGTAALVAALVVEVARRRPAWLRGDTTRSPASWTAPRGALSLLLALAALQVHAVRAAVRSRGAADWFATMAPAHRRWAAEAEIPDDPTGAQRLVLVTGVDFTTEANLPWIRRLDGHPLPHSCVRLSAAHHVHQLWRRAANVLEIAILSDALDHTMVDSLYRSASAPFRPGDAVAVPGLAVQVIATAGANPWRMRFTFDGDLDDPRYIFLHPHGGRLRQVALPKVGDSMRLPMAEGPMR